MKQFEVGKKYSARSACDYECVWTFKVIKRTAATVTLSGNFYNGVKSKTFRVNQKEAERWGYETILPLGRYSMAPCLSADRPTR